MSEIIKTNTEYSNRQQLVDDSERRICQQAVDDCIFMIPWDIIFR